WSSDVCSSDLRFQAACSTAATSTSSSAQPSIVESFPFGPKCPNRPGFFVDRVGARSPGRVHDEGDIMLAQSAPATARRLKALIDPIHVVAYFADEPDRELRALGLRNS